LRNFPSNAYEIELPEDMGIYPIFNVENLYSYVEPEAEKSTNDLDRDIGQQVKWQKQIPTEKKLQMERIIDTRVLKKTRVLWVLCEVEGSSTRRCYLGNCCTHT
jgi:hypothetical protein